MASVIALRTLNTTSSTNNDFYTPGSLTLSNFAITAKNLKDIISHASFSAEFANGSIGSEKISFLDGGKILSLSITGSKIAENSLPPSKLTVGRPFWSNIGIVGIGTDNPSQVARLVVEENRADTIARVSLTTSNNKGIMYSTTKTGTASIGWSVGQDVPDSNKFKIASSTDSLDTNTRLTILTDGKVGINTTSPAATLEVKGSATNDTVPEVRIAGASGYIDFHNSLTAGGYNPLVAADDKAVIFSAGSINSTCSLTIAPWSTTSGGLRILSTGVTQIYSKLSINTTASNSTLNIGGGIRAVQGLPADDNSNVGYAFGDDGDTGMFATTSPDGPAAAGTVVLMGNSVKLMTLYQVSAVPRVGINTVTPEHELDVNGTISANVLYAKGRVGTEGGQLNLIKPVTTDLKGTHVSLDIQSNKFRVFEEGDADTKRGVFVDLTKCGNVASSELWHDENASIKVGAFLDSNTVRTTSTTQRIDGTKTFISSLRSKEFFVGPLSSDGNVSLLTGLANSKIFSIHGGTLSNVLDSSITLGSFGFITSNNNVSLGLIAKRLKEGTAWKDTAIGLSYNVDNTEPVNGSSIWISAAGNIGIKTSSPTVDLDVNGVLKATSITLTKVSEASQERYFYNFGCNQTVGWRVIATFKSDITLSYKGTSGKLTFHSEESNYGVNLRKEYVALFHIKYSEDSVPKDDAVIQISNKTAGDNHIRLIKRGTRWYELQVSEHRDWNCCGAILDIDFNNGTLTVVSPDANTVAGVGVGTVVTSSSYNESTNITGSASTLQTSRDLWGNAFNGSSDVSGDIVFGSVYGQRLRLYGTEYGIGVQTNNLYYRTKDSFGWFIGGSHVDANMGAGTGGKLQMSLDASGNLVSRGSITARSAAAFNVGYVSLNSGNDTKPGYIHFNLPDTTRVGYIGWSSSTDKLDIRGENGYTFNFTEVPTVSGHEVLTKNTIASEGVGEILLTGSTSTYAATTVEEKHRTNTYLTLGPNGSSNDWAYLRQLGGNNAYSLSLDFHDDGDDTRFSIRGIKSANAELPDEVRDRIVIDATNTTLYNNLIVNSSADEALIRIKGSRVGTHNANRLVFGDNLNSDRYWMGTRGALDGTNAKFILYYYNTADLTSNYQSVLVISPNSINSKTYSLELKDGILKIDSSNNTTLAGELIVTKSKATRLGSYVEMGSNQNDASDVRIEVGVGRVKDADNASSDTYIDLISEYSESPDYNLRIARFKGANNSGGLYKKGGTGSLQINNESAGSIVFSTNNTTRLTISSTGVLSNPDGTITSSSNIVVNNGAPTIFLQDSDNKSAMIHVNDGTLFVLTNTTNNNTTTWNAGPNGRYPMVMNLGNGDVSFSRDVYVGVGDNTNDETKTYERLATRSFVSDAVSVYQTIRAYTHTRFRITYKSPYTTGLTGSNIRSKTQGVLYENIQRKNANSYVKISGNISGVGDGEDWNQWYITRHNSSDGSLETTTENQYVYIVGRGTWNAHKTHFCTFCCYDNTLFPQDLNTILQYQLRLCNNSYDFTINGYNSNIVFGTGTYPDRGSLETDLVLTEIRLDGNTQIIGVPNSPF